MTTLRIQRDRSWFGLLVSYRVDLGLEQVAKLRAGQTVEIHVDPGLHRLTVWSGRSRIGDEAIEVSNSMNQYLITHGAQPRWKSLLAIGGQPVEIVPME